MAHALVNSNGNQTCIFTSLKQKILLPKVYICRSTVRDSDAFRKVMNRWCGIWASEEDIWAGSLRSAAKSLSWRRNKLGRFCERRANGI